MMPTSQRWSIVVIVLAAGAFALCANHLMPQRIETTDMRFVSGNLTLFGTLYLPEPATAQLPGVVICHGGTRRGRRLALYVAMARALALRGYAVLTFDFRGFGDSDDPQRLRTFADLDFVTDVSAALTALSKQSQVDATRLYAVGHSFGAGVAVMAGIRDPRVRKVVSISAGRGTMPRFFGENATDPDYPQKRMSRDMKIAPPIPQALFYPHLMDYIAEAILDYPTHPPVLLVDGANERAEELTFLNDVYDRMTPPKGYVTIPGADHYFGTKMDQDGSRGDFPYNRAVLNALIDALAHWLR